jgi:hypothetical protein
LIVNRKPPSDQSRRLPRRLYSFFWEVNPKQVDLRRHAEYVIERLLEHGDLSAIRWLLKTYSERQIVRVVKRSRQLSRKTANFWRLRLAIPKAEVLVLRRPRSRLSAPFG